MSGIPPTKTEQHIELRGARKRERDREREREGERERERQREREMDRERERTDFECARCELQSIFFSKGVLAGAVRIPHFHSTDYFACCLKVMSLCLHTQNILSNIQPN